jgi:K+-sensing histidine kinase KdpD
MKSATKAFGEGAANFGISSAPVTSHRVFEHAVFRYGLAVLSVAAALAIKLILQHFNVGYPLSSSFLAAIAIAFWYGGTGPGILSVVLSFAAFGYFVLPHEVDYRMVLPDGSTKPVYLTANGRSEWRPDGGA